MKSELLSNWLGDKKVSSSIIGAIALYYTARYVGGSQTVSLPSMLGGQTIPVWLLGGVLGLGTSFVVDTISDTLLPHIPFHEKYKKTESIVVHILAGGMAYAFIPKILYSISGQGGRITNERLRMFAMAGVGTEVVSQLLAQYLGKGVYSSSSASVVVK